MRAARQGGGLPAQPHSKRSPAPAAASALIEEIASRWHNHQVLPAAVTQDPSQVRARAVFWHWAVVFVLAMSPPGTSVSQSSQPSLETILKRAQDAQLQKDFLQAAKEYREASKLRPSAEVYEKLGLACFLGNSFPEATEALSESVRLDPRHWSSQLYLGISLYKTNRFRQALPHIERALELEPQQNETRYWLGCTYHA